MYMFPPGLFIFSQSQFICILQPKIKQLEKCKHPNSRKTRALTKQIKKQQIRQKHKLSSNIKLNLIGEKLLWFKDQVDPQWAICSPQQVDKLIAKYLSRFDEELEQINIKHSIGHRKNRQHASREDIINLTIKREKEEFNTCGIEMPNLLDLVQFNLLRTWNGELRFLQNFKLRMFSKKTLEEEEKRLNKPAKHDVSSSNQENKGKLDNEDGIAESQEKEKNMEVEN
ncbi:unnamed protein product [Phaedon cochleariae]|uniref:Translation machinery-associated protein 16 n=1 Tax=Phaedon cochleariae TaxID=80249 RepID=A0A9P0DRB7_PHACE|nr:unnamed protein product [Phaedon cochleariae]